MPAKTTIFLLPLLTDGKRCFPPLMVSLSPYAPVIGAQGKPLVDPEGRPLVAKPFGRLYCYTSPLPTTAAGGPRDARLDPLCTPGGNSLAVTPSGTLVTWPNRQPVTLATAVAGSVGVGATATAALVGLRKARSSDAGDDGSRVPELLMLADDGSGFVMPDGRLAIAPEGYVLR